MILDAVLCFARRRMSARPGALTASSCHRPRPKPAFSPLARQAYMRSSSKACLGLYTDRAWPMVRNPPSSHALFQAQCMDSALLCFFRAKTFFSI